MRAVAHGQDGEGAAGQELLLGDAAVRALMARHQHQRDLAVGPGARADARLLAQGAEASLGRGDQPRDKLLPAFEAQIGTILIASDLDHFVGRHQLDVPARRDPPQQGGPQEAVLDDPAHGRGVALGGRGLPVVEMQEQRAWPAIVAGIGDPDVEDGFGLVRHLRPYAERVEQALAGIGDGGGASVEAGVREVRQWYAVDQGGAQPRFARGERQQAAVQSGAHDGEIQTVAVHGP